MKREKHSKIAEQLNLISFNRIYVVAGHITEPFPKHICENLTLCKLWFI